MRSSRQLMVDRKFSILVESRSPSISMASYPLSSMLDATLSPVGELVIVARDLGR